MKPAIKWGLIAGAVGAVLNVCVATAFGFCGPFVALLAGAAAGFFTGQAPGLASKGAAAREGAMAGGVAGALVLVGQVLGAVGAIFLLQASGSPTLFGSLPTPSDPAAQQAGMWVGAIGTGACFGVVGLALSAVTAAGVAYLAGPRAGTPAAASPPGLS